MSDDCGSPSAIGPAFPCPVWNRPGLPSIGYRIGAYDDFRAELLRRLDRDGTLAGWTHREPDDPGIALLECASVVGDVLTFYQELYANEAYLRTARWRESVGDLVRLVGYRLAPGVGGRATFAFQVKGADPVTVPAGFALKAELVGGDAPVDFETEDEIAAYPALSRFHLYRPRAAGTIAAGGTVLEVASAGGATGPAALAAVELKQGDRVMLVPDTPGGEAEILVVSRVERVLDRLAIHFRGALTAAHGASVTAYRLGRTFRHFGAAAPPQIVTTTGSTATTGSQVGVAYTSYDRPLGKDFHPSDDAHYPTLSPVEFPLDHEVNDLAAGGAVVCEARVWTNDAQQPLTVARSVRRVAPASLTWGQQTAGCSVVTLDDSLPGGFVLVTLTLSSASQAASYGHASYALSATFATSAAAAASAASASPAPGSFAAPATSAVYMQVQLPPIYQYLFAHRDGDADIRTLRLHETLGPALTLTRPVDGPGGAFAEPLLAYLGTRGEARALAGRPLLLETAGGAVLDAAVAADPDPALAGGAPGDGGVWPVRLAAALPGGLQRGDFDERVPTVTVYGNLAGATQGKHERDAVLGTGDARQAFQTFTLPKAPLTWLPDPGQAPPVAPGLEVWVGGRKWARVESFFAAGPLDEVYVVREDLKGDTHVQFGDGKTGRRLPSGVKNVVARYRTGTGAHGALKPGKTVQAGRLDRLVKVTLPGVASGGAGPEEMEGARLAAPGRLQSLDRLVSLSDYEAEALAIPGVTRARAAWELSNGVPAVVLTVLMEGGREGEYAAVAEALRGLDRCRGPRRHPLHAAEGHFAYVAVAAEMAIDPALRRDDVEAAVRAALGVYGGPEGELHEGLFSARRRRFAEREWATRVAATIQNVPGVAWTRVTTLAALGRGADPAAIPLPPPAVPPTLPCLPGELLRLHHAHLRLTPVSAPAQEC